MTTRLLFLSFFLVLATYTHAYPHACGVAKGWGCGGGACEVLGWQHGCIPKCAGRTVSCGRPVGRRNGWRAKQCKCSAGVAQCRMRCRHFKRRKCEWRRYPRYRYKPRWHRYRKRAGRRHGSFSRRGDGDDDHDHGFGVWRWYKKPHWERYYTWTPVCRKRKFTKCFCPSNPCRCDRKKPKPSVAPTPSSTPTPSVTGTSTPTSTPSPTPSMSAIVTTVAPSPVQAVPDIAFDPAAPLNLP